AEVSIKLSAPVEKVLRHAHTPIALGELHDRVAGEFPDAGRGAVARMLSALVLHGFLVTELRPPMTCTDPLTNLIETASRAGADQDPGVAPVVGELRVIRQLLDGHNAAVDDSAGPSRRELRSVTVMRMRGLADAESTLGVDLHVDAEVAIPVAVTAEAAAAAAALVRLAPEPGGTAAWRDYHQRFLDRYGPGAIVALPELLHSGSGLGYPAGYRGTSLPTRRPRVDAHTRGRTELLTRLAQTTAWERQREIALTDADLDALADVASRPQPHTELRVEIHSPTRDALDRGRFDLLVLGASRASGTVMGRFLDLLDLDESYRIAAALRGLPTVTDGARRVQLSGPPLNLRAATIARAMAVMPHQLVVGGHPPAGGLLPADLAVSADTVGLYLVTAATGEPIEPLAATALEMVRGADPLLRFVSEIATSSCSPCQPFTWGSPFGEAPHLPRVRYRRTVLAPASWTVRADELPRDPGREGWRAWRERWAVPDEVLLREHDRRLRLNLADPAHLH
ncbi:MAG: lantibiotic dehydratase family protein, partial [Pseudonocardia sp.]